jgi:hypothetical protein
MEVNPRPLPLPSKTAYHELHRQKSGKNDSVTRDPQRGGYALPTSYSAMIIGKWGEDRSNLRRHTPQIYSLRPVGRMVSPS